MLSRSGAWLATAVVSAGSALALAVCLAEGRPAIAAALAAAPLVPVLGGGLIRRVALTDRRQLFVEGVVLALLMSTLVWRIRGTEALDENPLDTAAGLRVALVAAAFLASLRVVAASGFGARLPAGIRLTAVYVILSGVAAFGSPAILQAGYRTFELATGLLVLIAAGTLLGERAGKTVVDAVFVFLGALAVVVWLEAMAVPGLAWNTAPQGSIISIQLTGVLPHLSANSVGTIGALLAVRGLVVSDVRLRWAVTSWGLLTLVASQERTGVVGFALAATVILVLRRRYSVAWVLAGTLTVLALAGGLGALVESAQTGLERGQDEANLRSLSGRTQFWSSARPLVEERPWLGWGLNVGSREVLSRLGRDTTSTIHGAWMEATLGVGIPGALVLGLALLVVLVQAAMVRDALATGVMVMLAVRSITGTSIELFGVGFVLFGGVALLVAARARERARAKATAPPGLVAEKAGLT